MKKLKIFIIIIFIIGGIFITKGTIDIISAKSDSESNIKNQELIQNENLTEIEQNYTKTNEVQKENSINKEQIAEEQKYNIKQTVDKEYFNDALFIGDSRTVGISEYGDLNNATFFANPGMSVYNVFDKNVSVPKVGKLKLKDLLTSKQYGKVYVMLGINELGYNITKTLENYKKLLEYIENTQKNAIIYVEANLHVTEEKSKKDKIINNANIDKFNNEISKLADNKKIFYIDINEKFDDKSGNLSSEYTKDNVHIYAKHYKEWSNWLTQNAIKKGG